MLLSEYASRSFLTKWPSAIGASDARREAGVRAQRLTQRGHQVALDHVEEDPGDGIFTVEEVIERVAGQDEQERPLACDRGDG
jgi:hypothetical protein